MSPADTTAPEPVAILAMIRAAMPTLPHQQQQLAKLALEAPSEVGRMTITEFAGHAGTSAASVTRFCRSLGLEKFAQLRTELVIAGDRDGTSPTPRIVGDLTGDTPFPVLLESLSALASRSLEETARCLDQEALAQIADSMSAASHVYTTGAGSAHAAALSLSHKIRSLGITSTCFHDPPSAVIGLASARPGDVLVVVSETGTPSEAAPQLAEAHRRGCTTVLITRLQRSPAAELADHVLLAVQGDSPVHTGSLTSRIAEMFIADCLAGAIVVRTNDRSLEALTSVEEALERYW